MGLELTGESLKNEGTGFDGRVDGSLERQDWKDGITRENFCLKRLAIFCLCSLGLVFKGFAVSKHELFCLRKGGINIVEMWEILFVYLFSPGKRNKY